MPPAIFIETWGWILVAILFFIAIIWVALYHSSVNVGVNLGHHIAKHNHVSLEGLHRLVFLRGKKLVGEMKVFGVWEVLVYPFALAITYRLVKLRGLFR